MGQPIRKFSLTTQQPIPHQRPKPQLRALRKQAATEMPTIIPNILLYEETAPAAGVLFLHAPSFATLRPIYLSTNHQPNSNLNPNTNINLNLNINHHRSAATLSLQPP
jgi:hypothetical protein